MCSTHCRSLEFHCKSTKVYLVQKIYTSICIVSHCKHTIYVYVYTKHILEEAWIYSHTEWCVDAFFHESTRNPIIFVKHISSICKRPRKWTYHQSKAESCVCVYLCAICACVRACVHACMFLVSFASEYIHMTMVSFNWNKTRIVRFNEFSRSFVKWRGANVWLINTFHTLTKLIFELMLTFICPLSCGWLPK